MNVSELLRLLLEGMIVGATEGLVICLFHVFLAKYIS